MFVDYYTLLEIAPNSTFDEIKSAFRKQAIKWHTDKNKGIDTTEIMQLINEAYLILKDPEAKERYDIEYKKFKVYNDFKEQKPQESENKESVQAQDEAKFKYEEYDVKDETLKRWMENARRQAVELAKQTIKEFGEIVYTGAKEGAKGALRAIIFQVIGGIILLLIFGKSCR